MSTHNKSPDEKYQYNEHCISTRKRQSGTLYIQLGDKKSEKN